MSLKSARFGFRMYFPIEKTISTAALEGKPVKKVPLRLKALGITKTKVPRYRQANGTNLKSTSVPVPVQKVLRYNCTRYCPTLWISLVPVP